MGWRRNGATNERKKREVNKVLHNSLGSINLENYNLALLTLYELPIMITVLIEK